MKAALFGSRREISLTERPFWSQSQTCSSRLERVFASCGFLLVFISTRLKHDSRFRELKKLTSLEFHEASIHSEPYDPSSFALAASLVSRLNKITKCQRFASSSRQGCRSLVSDGCHSSVSAIKIHCLYRTLKPSGISKN